MDYHFKNHIFYQTHLPLRFPEPPPVKSAAVSIGMWSHGSYFGTEIVILAKDKPMFELRHLKVTHIDSMIEGHASQQDDK